MSYLLRVTGLFLFTLVVCAFADVATSDNLTDDTTPVPVATITSPLATATPYELDRMIVTASRGRAVDPMVVPQSVATISSADFSSTVRTNLADYVQTIPGVGLAPSGGTGDTTNRNSDYWSQGFSIRGLGGQRVLTLTDGVRQSGQGVGYGGGNLSLYDTTAIERVEVVKGPSSVLYGTDAFGGVVQIFTRQPTVRDTFGVGGRIRTSWDDSRDSWTTGGFVDLGQQDWGIVAGGSHTNASLPNLPQNRTPEGGSYIKDSGFANVTLRPTEDSQLRLLSNVTTARNIDIFTQTILTPGDFFFHIPYYQRAMAGIDYTKDSPSARITQYRVGLYVQQLQRQFQRSTPIFTPPSTFTFDRVQTDDTLTTTELQSSVVFDYSPHTLTVGADIGYDRAYLTDITGSTATNRANAQQTRVGLYAQDVWEASPRHIFTLGTRFDNFSLNDDRQFKHASQMGLSGSAGYTFRATPDTSFYATLASGFRSPDLDERYQNTAVQFFTQLVTVQGNPDLDPERSTSIDFGVKREADYGQFEVGSFFNNVQDYIGLKTISTTSLGAGRTSVVRQRSNIGSVNLFGVEAGWRAPTSSPWRSFISAHRTWTDSPRDVALTNVQVRYGTGYAFSTVGPFRAVTPSVAARYVFSSRDTVNNVKFPAYNVVDAQIAFDYHRSSLYDTQLVVGVKNIFNVLYDEAFYAQPQPGRGVFASLQVDF